MTDTQPNNMFEHLQSTDIKELAKALSIAQGQIENAAKDTQNAFFKSKYATLASIREACRDALAKNGLSVAQLPTQTSGGLVLCTTLMHGSGQWLRSFLPINPVKNDPQGLGSAITYMRRYALAAITGVAPDEDDDGNAASGNVDKADKAQPKGIGSAPGNMRTGNKEFDRKLIPKMLDDINKGNTPQEVDKIHSHAAKYAKENGATSDQIDQLQMQADNRKAFLANQKAGYND